MHTLSSAIITCRRTLILIRRSCPSVIDCAINMLHSSRKYSCSRASRRSGCSSILFMLSLKIMVALGVLLLTCPSSRLLTILLASSRCFSSMSTGQPFDHDDRTFHPINNVRRAGADIEGRHIQVIRRCFKEVHPVRMF